MTDTYRYLAHIWNYFGSDTVLPVEFYNVYPEGKVIGYYLDHLRSLIWINLKGFGVNHLRKTGFRVDLVPVEFEDYCMLEICGHEVFRCNIKNLLFNTPAALDPVCLRAIEACNESSRKLKRARHYFWLLSQIENQVFKRSEFAPKNHWPVDVKLQDFATCLDCIKCCDMLVHPKKDNG